MQTIYWFRKIIRDSTGVAKQKREIAAFRLCYVEKLDEERTKACDIIPLSISICNHPYIWLQQPLHMVATAPTYGCSYNACCI